MSTYLDMWGKIKELTPEQREEWINVARPCRGQVINFKGVRVIDVDLVEALKNAH
jgi:hypothetical protein